MFEFLEMEDKMTMAIEINDTWIIFKEERGVDGETTYDQFSAFFDGLQTAFMLSGMSQEDFWEIFDLTMEIED